MLSKAAYCAAVVIGTFAPELCTTLSATGAAIVPVLLAADDINDADSAGATAAFVLVVNLFDGDAVAA